MAAEKYAEPVNARERILESAYELFSHHGVRGTGIDAILRHSGVARVTLYRHFRSKDELVLAFLQRREEVWTKGWLENDVRQRALDARGRLLAIFDVFANWFERHDFEGCSFVNVMLESTDPDSPLFVASVRHLAVIREYLASLARDAGVPDPHDFAQKWHILMKGAIVLAAGGEREAAARAQEIGVLLLEHYLPKP